MKQRGLRWVSDFRDPLPSSRKFMSANPRVAQLQTEIVRDPVYECDAVTCISSNHPLILQDAFDPARLRPMHHIPTGVDEAYLPADRPAPDPANPVVVYAGEFIADYTNGFFDLFAEVAQQLRTEGRNLTMKVVGATLINRPLLTPNHRGARPRIEGHAGGSSAATGALPPHGCRRRRAPLPGSEFSLVELLRQAE